MKKGQITVFIILGIILLLMTLIGVYLAAETRTEIPEGIDTTRIRSFIDSCIEDAAYDGLKTLGRQGGYIDIPDLIKADNTSYWYLDQINIQPALSTIGQRLETYINENLRRCDFQTFGREGYLLEFGNAKANATFSANDVAIYVDYPVNIRKQDASARLESFSVILNVRFRRMFELASQIINAQLRPEFAFSDPLKNVQKGDFTVEVDYLGSQEIKYAITDTIQRVKGKTYSLQFAGRFKRSNLKRTITLQDNSNIVPTSFPIVAYSIDRMAQLILMPGTTFNLNGNPVPWISVQQFYPDVATRSNVPFHEHADDSVTYGEINWNLNHPVYQFEPTGMRFNSPQRLVIYWDDDQVPNRGNVGILYNEGVGWRPLQSKANYEENYVYTDIPGFSNYTIADCALQEEKEISATAEMDPGGKCWVTLVVIIVAIALLIVLIILTAGTLGVLASTSYTTFAAAWTSVSITGVGITVAVIGGVVGGAYINSELMYGTDKDTVVYTPTCDQTVQIHKEEKKGKGICLPKETGGEEEKTSAPTPGKEPPSPKEDEPAVIYEEPTGSGLKVYAGEPNYIHARVKKCTGMRKYFCGSCRVKCSTSYT